MQLNIYKDYQSLSEHVADEIIETIKTNPKAVLCLATGDTPRLAYQLLAKKATIEKVDFTLCTFIALDEWVGIPPENEGSCAYFLEAQVFGPLNMSKSQVFLFDALSKDPDGECKKMDSIIASNGAIDLLLAGVGMNGHIGFNEPGTSPEKYAHVIDLDDTTQSVGQKYFTNAVKIMQGITLGFRHILQSKELIMMANGAKKAAVIKKALEEDINNSMPASLIRLHSKAQVMIDEEAASLLKRPQSFSIGGES